MLGMLVSFSALIETLGVASILPYMALLTTPESDIAKRVFSSASQVFGASSREQIAVLTGVFVFIAIVIGTTVSGLATWLSLRFTMIRAHSLSMRILESYLASDYEFFIQRRSSELLKNLLSEVSNVVGGVLTPLIQMSTRLIVTVLIVALLFIVDAAVALTSVSIFLVVYLTIYSLSRRALSRMGSESIKTNEARYRVLSELFGGIREVKLWNKERYYSSAFAIASARFADLNANSQLIALLPRYGLEIVAFGGMVLVTIFLAGSEQGISSYLPLMSLYAIAGYKLLPSLQQIYVNLASLRYSAASLDVLMGESKKWVLESNVAQQSAEKETVERLSGEIEFENVSYQYPTSSEPAIGAINLRIPECAVIGIIGPSGAGKSTLLDLMLGLLEPSSGRILINGVPMTEELRRHWSGNVGYVPQSIFLTDGSVAENIAFGTAAADIDMNAVIAAAKTAQIYEFIQTLPEKFDTYVGERGLRLSGGQRQRIAIARALYRNPTILIFDEATSALDSETEDAVMDAVASLAHKKTIVIVTHRISTLRDCDYLYAMKDGKLAPGRLSTLSIPGARQ